MENDDAIRRKQTRKSSEVLRALRDAVDEILKHGTIETFCHIYLDEASQRRSSVGISDICSSVLRGRFRSKRSWIRFMSICLCYPLHAATISKYSTSKFIQATTILNKGNLKNLVGRSNKVIALNLCRIDSEKY